MTITKKFLEHHYLTLRKSSYLISQELGVKRHDVSNALYKYGIARKNFAKDGMKYCSGCKTEKTLDNFHKSKSRASGVTDFCKTCTKSRAPRYYSRVVKNRTTQKAELILEFGNKCQQCGAENLPISCYVFHHVDEKMTDETYFRPNTILMSRNKDFVNQQKKKLALLCANCHNLVHSDCKLTATEFLRE